MENGKLIFFGTSEVCLPFLNKLTEDHSIGLIITQPDSIGGRKRKKIIPAVKSFASENNIRCEQPLTLKQDDIKSKIESISPVIGVVISYGQMIPDKIFSIPAFKTVNVHFSLLPMYRGAAPLQRSLENDDIKTGITIFEINKGMDSGDIWARKEFVLFKDDNYLTISERMGLEGPEFLNDTINKIISGQINKIPQDHTRATYAGAIEKKEGCIKWGEPARKIHNKLRAFKSWPGLYFTANDKMIKVIDLKVCSSKHTEQSGKIVSIEKTGIKIACGDNSVIQVTSIQPAGKNVMPPYNFCLGNNLPVCLI